MAQSRSTEAPWMHLSSGFCAVLECPRNANVRSHTLQYACVRGWVGSAAPVEFRVELHVAGRGPIDVPATRPRGDVVAALAPAYGITQAVAFSSYVRLPEPLLEPLAVRVEVTDGRERAASQPFQLSPEIDLNLLDTYVGSPGIFAELALRHLAGRGLEFGALHAPLRVDPSRAQMAYADTRTRDAARRLFFDMGTSLDSLVDVQYLVDLNDSDLEEIAAQNFDLFVLNGVLEHLANPLRALDHLDRVMKPGARLFLAVPDRDFTFDTRRALTPFEHLWKDFVERVETVDDQHVLDALSATLALPADDAGLVELIDVHRPSVHAHVWNQASFDEFFERAQRALSWQLTSIERVSSLEAEGNIVYVLEKGPSRRDRRL
jgi:SAM-dependent methyltransferase